MRNEILQLKDLGRMPNESINDSDSIDKKYSKILLSYSIFPYI